MASSVSGTEPRSDNEHPESGVRFSSLLLSEDGGLQISYSLPEGRGRGVVEYRTVTVYKRDLPAYVYSDMIQYIHLLWDQIERHRADRLAEIIEREE